MKKITRKEAEEIAARINDWIAAEEKRAEENNDVTRFEWAGVEIAEDGLERGWEFPCGLTVYLNLWKAHDRKQDAINWELREEVRRLIGPCSEEFEDEIDGQEVDWTAIVEVESDEKKGGAQ